MPNEKTYTDLVVLASLLRVQNKFEQAESQYLRALDGYEKAFEPDFPETLTVVHILGVLYRGRGQIEQAEKMWIRALAGYGKALEPDHPDTLRAVQNLGYEKALEPNHPDTLRVVQDLGLLYYKRGQDEQALTLLTRAMLAYEVSEVTFSPICEVIGSLCDHYEAQNKLAEATEMCERHLQIITSVGTQAESLTLEVVRKLSNLTLWWSAEHAPGSETIDDSLAIAKLGKLAHDWGHRWSSIYDALGKVLLRASDNANANIAFQQQIEIQDDEKVFKENPLCDMLTPKFPAL